MSDPDRHLQAETATPFEKALNGVNARLLDLDQNVIRRNREATSVEKEFLPALAWERSVHHWSGDEATDRDRTETSFADHGTYGRPDAQEGEIALDTGVNVRVVEFFEDATLEWPDFVVEMRLAAGVAQGDLSAVAQSAICRKNVRDWPSRLRVRGPDVPGGFSIGVATRPFARVAILPSDPVPPFTSFVFGAATRSIPSHKVLPL